MCLSKNTSSSKEEDPVIIYTCVICLNNVDSEQNKPHSTTRCSHESCRDCCRQYFQNVLKGNNFKSDDDIECPSYGCRETFDNLLDIFWDIFTAEEERAWWNNALIKTFITHRVQCPVKSCGYIYDAKAPDLEQCSFSECSDCRKGFCIACEMPWNNEHEEGGKYYESYVEEKNNIDIWKQHNMTLDLAEELGWSRCPKCAHIVTISDGCNNIICRCGAKFCFNCGRLSPECRDQCYNMNQEALNILKRSMFDF